MRATNGRFIRLRNMADLRSVQTNANFLISLMDRYEGKNSPDNKEMHSVEVQEMPLNLSLSFMLKEKPKRPTSSVSGCVRKLYLVNRFCPQLVRMKLILSVDSLIVLL